MLASLSALGPTSSQAAAFSSWAGARVTSTGHLTDVAFVNGERVYSGYEVSTVPAMLFATLYTTTGTPGMGTVTQTDLGFATFDSISVSISHRRLGGYWATASETLPAFETRSYLFWSADLGTPIPVIGPPPANDPDVVINSINHHGKSVGSLGGVTPLVSDSTGLTTTLPYPFVGELLGVDSSGNLLAGTAEPSPGAPLVATIFDANGAVLYQDTLPGYVSDIEAPFAVGQRDGKVAYWRQAGGSWQPYFINGQLGTPLVGELASMDHRGRGLAGGSVTPGAAIAVDLMTGSFVRLDTELGLPAGTLYGVVGVDVDPQTWQAAFAVEAGDFSGWEVTLSVTPAVPGPGLWLALPLTLAGALAPLRRRR